MTALDKLKSVANVKESKKADSTVVDITITPEIIIAQNFFF